VNLAALLFDVARRQPKAPAVSDGVHAWSYSEFARRISCLAGGLVANGLEPGDRIILCMENCAEFLEMVFACWAAGLCAVPVNARLHANEVAYIAEDSRARLMIATPSLAAALASLERSAEALSAIIATGSDDYGALLERAEPLQPVEGSPTDRAWLFYSAGQPAGPRARC